MKLSNRDFAVCSYCPEVAVVRCDHVGALTFGVEPDRCRRPLCVACMAVDTEQDVWCREHAKEAA